MRLRVLAWTQRRCYIIIIDNEQICSQSLRQSPGTYLLLLLLLTHARSNTSLGHVEWDHSLGTDRWGRQRLNDAMTSGPILLLTASPWKDRAHASDSLLLLLAWTQHPRRCCWSCNGGSSKDSGASFSSSCYTKEAKETYYRGKRDLL